MADSRKAAALAAMAFGILIGSCVLASILPRLGIAVVAAGFAGYVLCGRRAMVLWRADEAVFNLRRTWVPRPGVPSVVTLGLMAGAIGSVALGHGDRTGQAIRRNAGGTQRVREASPDEVQRPLTFPSPASRTKHRDV